MLRDNRSGKSDTVIFALYEGFTVCVYQKMHGNSAEALKSGMQDGTLQILPDAGK